MSVLTTTPAEGLADGLDLVVRFQAGDPDAFADIYRRHQPTVFFFVYHRVKNKQLAEDLTQDTFMKAFRRLGAFEVRDRALAAWLVTIARNLVADHFKSANTRLCTLGGIADIVGVSGDVWALPPVPAADEEALRYLESADLLTLLRELTDSQQDVLICRFFRGLSVAETAHELGLHEGAVKAVQFRACRTLARLMRLRERR